MTTNEFIEEAQVLFDRLNNSYLELHKLYEFYDTDIWVRFNKIHSSDAEGAIERFVSFVPGMEANSIYCFKLIFDWIEVAKKQVKPISQKYMLPKMIETGKRYCIISPTRNLYEIYIEDGAENLNLEASLRKIEAIVCEWEEFIESQKRQAEVICYRLRK